MKNPTDHNSVWIRLYSCGEILVTFYNQLLASNTRLMLFSTLLFMADLLQVV